MRVDLYDRRRYAVLILSFMVVVSVVSISNSIIVHIICFFLFCAIQMVGLRLDLLHPYCWFSAFFALYGCGFPIIIAIGLPSRTTYTKDIMIIQLIALFTFLLVVGPHSNKRNVDVSTENLQIKIGVFNKIINVFLVLIILFTGIYVYRSGYSGKGQIYTEGGILLNAVFKLPLILALLSTVSFISSYSREKKVPTKQLLFSGTALLVITAFSGERDFVFRYVMMIMLAMWFFEIIKIKHLLVLAPIMALSIPLSATYKYYFTQGVTATRAVSSKSLIYSIFYGEFESASCNLQVLLNDTANTKGRFGFTQILYDIASAFYSKIPSTGAWFNQHYYPNSQNVQYGFSIVGEGYVIEGVVGIVVLMAIIALITRWYYNHATYGIYFLGGYIYYITTVIYAIRGDFSNITSALTKQIGLVITILYLAGSVSNNSWKFKIPRLHKG